MLRNRLFDPFGERAIQATDPSRGSVVLSRVGLTLFWLLVLVIVAARAFYQP